MNTKYIESLNVVGSCENQELEKFEVLSKHNLLNK